MKKANKKPIKRQVHSKFYTGNISPNIDALLTYANDDYIEIQRQTYRVGFYLLLSTFLVICIIAMLGIIWLIGHTGKGQGLIFLLVLVIPLFAYQAFVMIKTLIFQPSYQPIVFHRKQGKVYIYQNDIYGSKSDDPQTTYLNDKRVMTTGWLCIQPRIFAEKTYQKRAILIATTYAISLYDSSNNINVSLLTFERHFNEIENKVYLKGIWNWLVLYMQYDQSLPKPTSYATQLSKLWPESTLVDFNRDK